MLVSPFQIFYQNISTLNPQKNVWVTVGLPKDHGIPFLNKKFSHLDKSWEIRVRDQELFLRGDFGAGQNTTLDVYHNNSNSASDEVEPTPEPFKFSDWVADQPEKLLPSFVITTESDANLNSEPMVFYTGVGPKPLAFFTLESSNDVRLRFKFRTRILAADITLDGWIDVFHEQDIVPIIVRASFGTVTGEKVVSKRYKSLRMITGEKPVIDFYKAKGLKETIYRTDLLRWETEIVSPRLWYKARTIEVFGALLALPDYSILGQYVSNPTFVDRFNTLKAREEGPVVAFADVWDGKWLATGSVPDKVNINSSQLYNSFVSRLRNSGDEYNGRAYAQPPNSRQTGEQPDFGVSRGELVVSQKLAFMLHDYRFSVQAWMLRPYSHKESNGDPVTKANHPNTKLYELSVDFRFGTDHLGFPANAPYSEFWTGSDNQHRSDNLLYAMYALTRDPSIKATIEDLVQCSLMELKVWEYYGMPNGNIGSPRGWGRPLLSMAHAVSLGFNELRPNLIEMCNVMYQGAALRKLSNDGQNTVRTLSNTGSKYGWVDNSGRPIRAWVCWEEAIAVIGLWAAYKVTGDLNAKELALDLAITITRHAFFKQMNKWYACYAVRVNEPNTGIPLPDSLYVLGANPDLNKDIVVYNAMSRWMLASVIIVRDESVGPLSSRAAEIVSAFSIGPMSTDDSAWRAI